MRVILRLSQLIAISSSLAAVAHAAAPSTFLVVVLAGPHAGTYPLSDAGHLCFHSKAQRVYSAVWEGAEVRDPNAIGQAGVEVANPDTPGPKVGSLRISFGDTKGKPTVYEIASKPLIFSVNGTDANIVLEGVSASGIGLKIKVFCHGADEL